MKRPRVLFPLIATAALLLFFALEHLRQAPYRRLTGDGVSLSGWQGGLNRWQEGRDDRWFLAWPLHASIDSTPADPAQTGAALRTCRSLTEVSLAAPPGLPSLQALGSLPGLQTLALQKVRLSDDEWHLLLGPQLQGITLLDTTLSSATLARIAALPRLRLLVASECQVAEEDLLLLAGTPTLRTLILRDLKSPVPIDPQRLRQALPPEVIFIFDTRAIIHR